MALYLSIYENIYSDIICTDANSHQDDYRRNRLSYDVLSGKPTRRKEQDSEVYQHTCQSDFIDSDILPSSPSSFTPGVTMVTAGNKSAVSRSLEDWSFTQVGGGQGTKDGEWLKVSNFPTTVHVELLKLGRIPDPVSYELGVQSSSRC